MKRLASRTLVAFVAVAISSLLTIGCEAITDAATIKVPITVDVYPESMNPMIPQVDVDSIDLSNNQDITDNLDKFKGASLNKIEFKIIDLQNPQFDINAVSFTTVGFTLQFDPQYGDNKVYNLGTFSNIMLSTLLTSYYNVSITSDANAAVDKIADGQLKFTVSASYGPFTPGPVPAQASYLKGHIKMGVDFEAGL